MKQALVVVKEIQRLYAACEKTKSQYLRNDYCKQLKVLKRDLKEYCGYKNIDYNKMCEANNI